MHWRRQDKMAFSFLHGYYLFCPVSPTSPRSEIPGPKIAILGLKIPAFSAFTSYICSSEFSLSFWILLIFHSFPFCLSFLSLLHISCIYFPFPFPQDSCSEELSWKLRLTEGCLLGLGGSKQVKAMGFPHCSSYSEGEHFVNTQHKFLPSYNCTVNNLCCYTAPHVPVFLSDHPIPILSRSCGQWFILYFYAPLHALHTLCSFHRPGCLISFLLMQ